MACSSGHCEAHEFLVMAMEEMKIMDQKLLHNQQDSIVTLAILTENLRELQRTNERLEKIIERYEDKMNALSKVIEDVSKGHDSLQTKMYTASSLTIIAASCFAWLINLMYK